MSNAVAAVFETNLTSLPFLHRGKVRDIYRVPGPLNGPDQLLIIQTDRLSAFDVVLPDPIPGKGRVLTELSNFWFKKLAHVIPNHLTGIPPESVVSEADRAQVVSRAMVVRKYKPLKIEAVVRGYIIGSGWKDYQKTGMVCGIKLPTGLQEAEKLPEVIFTPSTKASAGQHDENIPYEEAEKIVGAELAAEIRAVSIQLYTEAAAYALTKGIIIADTKFEFGTDEYGLLCLIDEILTPDSSRFWSVDAYHTGISPPSYDKQIVRDWLENERWDKKPPGPHLPADVILKTGEKYREVLRILTTG